ncbi:hypothetical protein DRO32_00315 [Candidatus Bathyarchaeota archaeon]|nr:MAG: hypothetical protein DRO32_00315 [Candidatus Bathyarchaeota archaeon]
MDEDEFKELFETAYEKEAPWPGHRESMRKFRYEMEIGDIVIVASDGYIYAIGRIKSGYYYREEYMAYNYERPVSYERASELVEKGVGVDRFVIPLNPHRRDVEWLKITKLPFKSLPEPVRKKFGPRPTVKELTESDWELLKPLLML